MPLGAVRKHVFKFRELCLCICLPPWVLKLPMKMCISDAWQYILLVNTTLCSFRLTTGKNPTKTQTYHSVEISFLLPRDHANMICKTAVLPRDPKGVPALTTRPFAPAVFWLKTNTPHFIAFHVFTQIFRINLIKGKKWEIFAPKTKKFRPYSKVV